MPAKKAGSSRADRVTMPVLHQAHLGKAEPAFECPICPRLVAFRAANQAAHPGWFNGAVPSFGPETGRPFLGDYAGELLYQTLLKVGFARGHHDLARPEALTLVDCMITNAVRCVPPANKPTPSEITQCRQFLKAR